MISNVSTDGGNFIGRDQNVQGDVVKGDKVMGNKVIYETPKLRLPLQRPPRAEHFVDRETVLAQLLANLQPGQVFTLCGPGGMGKTALAAEAIWQLAPSQEPPDRFPDGIIYHDFYQEPQVALAFEKIAFSFGETPRPTPAAAAQRVLAGRCLLLLLDGAEQADDLPAILNVRDQCAVLITSRRHADALPNWADLSPLPSTEALSLLQAWGQHHATDIPTAQRICTLVGNLPLAIRLAGSYLHTRSRNSSEYLQWLEKTPLAALDQGKRQHNSVPILLERSLAQVSTAHQVMSVIGLLGPVPFTQETIAAALPSTSPVASVLDELVNYSLLMRSAQSYVVTHILIHTYAREQFLPSSDTVRQLANYFIHFIKTHQNDAIQLNLIRPHLHTLIPICLGQAAWTEINKLAWAINQHLALQGDPLDRITILEAALAEVRALQDRHDEGVHLGNLANTYRNLGQVEQAIVYYQQALAIAQEISDRGNKGVWLGGLGNVYRNLGQSRQAISYYQQALDIAKEIGDRENEGAWLGNLGMAYAHLGEMDNAVSCYLHALAVAQETKDRHSEEVQLGNLGNAYADLNQMEKAIDYYQQALDITKEIRDRRGEGVQLGNLGIMNASLNQMEKAIGYYQQALDIAREIGDRNNESTWLGNLGNAYRDLGLMDQAITYYRQALALAKKIKDRRSEGAWLSNLGIAYRNMGQMDGAKAHWNQALLIFEEIESPFAITVRKWLVSHKSH